MLCPHETTRCGVGSLLNRYPWGSWLARKDSNLRSPDPESVARNQPREPPFERAADRRRPSNRGESGAHPEMSQMPSPKTERVCCLSGRTESRPSRAVDGSPTLQGAPSPMLCRIRDRSHRRRGARLRKGVARPTGVGRAISTCTIPIEGRDEWLAAARRLA